MVGSRSFYFATALLLLTTPVVAKELPKSPRPAAATTATLASELNFGFPMGFSVSKMDLKADPRRDFKRYSAGRWLDKAVTPGDASGLCGLDQLGRVVKAQLGILIEETARSSATAPKGSPLQQVGDFYLSGMDTKHLSQLGVTPLQPELDRLAAMKTPQDLIEALVRLNNLHNEQVLFGISVDADLRDVTRYAIYFGDGELPMGLENYLKPEAKAIREAYLKYVADTLILAGSPPPEAKAMAGRILEMETRIARKKLTPVDKLNPVNAYINMPLADLKAVLSNIDLEAYFKALGVATPEQLIVTDIEALRERNAMLAELPMSETKAYLRWELLRRTSSFLSPAFQKPSQAFNQAISGHLEVPPRSKEVVALVPYQLGHPLSRLYVAKHFSPHTRQDVLQVVGRVKAEFRGRLEKNQWLSPETRRKALDKLSKYKITVGYPEHWIDYSGVDIRRDDFLGNVLRLNQFKFRRSLAWLGKPVVYDEFATPNSTLPVDVNAAYQPTKNGIEIPAAFLQPPFYDPKADAGVNFGTIGAVIGHEITHGFDSQGRLFDAQGNMREWWTPEDASKFNLQLQKLISQADSFEVFPGVHVNGKLTIGENLADAGGVSLATSCLRGYLQEHPEANRKIDGLTPYQRLYLAWAQMWSDKPREGTLRQSLATDAHAPGLYRLISPCQHEAGFYQAFGIRPGDPTWRGEKDRVRTW